MVVYAVVKLSVAAGRSGGLAKSMPYTPVGLSEAILVNFVIFSLLWVILALWSVRHLRARKKVRLLTNFLLWPKLCSCTTMSLFGGGDTDQTAFCAQL